MRSKTRRSVRQNVSDSKSFAPHSINALRADRLGAAVKPVFEQLEARQMLTTVNAHTVYVNDNWVVAQEGTNVGNQPGLDAGDSVDNTGTGDDGTLISGLTFGAATTTDPANAFDSIQSAVTYLSNHPGNGIDTIHVVSGTYATQANITLAGIHLEGDDVGINPNTGTRVPEAVLSAGNGSLVVSASNVTVDGFTIQDASSNGGVGINIAAGSGDVVQNNIITQNSNGMLVGSGASNIAITNNLVSSNNRSGTNRGQGVRIQGSSVTLTGNHFTGHAAGPAGTLAGAVTLDGATNASIGTTLAGNSFDNNSVAIRILNATTGTTIDSADFSAGTTRNTTDLLVQSTGAGAITEMKGDKFAAATTYIDYSGSSELNATDTGNTFGGVTASGNTNLTQQYAIADKITDGVDATGRGLVRVDPQQIYVTIASETGLVGAIQRAVNVAVAGDTIHVQAGTFKENVTVSKAVTLLGANTGVAGSGTRGTETVIQTSGNQNAVVTISSGGATIDGFTIDGDDPSVTGASLTSGDDTNVLYAVRPSGAFSNLTVANNIIEHADIGFRGDGTATGNSITRNWFDSIGAYDFGYAVSLRTNFYADVKNNLMTRVQDGLHTNNFSGAGPASWEFSGNTVQTYGAGVWDNLQYNGATSLKIDNNTISSLVAPTTPANAAVRSNFDGQSIGLLFVTLQNSVSATVTNNTISGMGYGVTFYNTETSNPVSIGSTNSIHDNAVGIYATNIVGFNPVSKTELGGDPSNVPPGFSGPNNPTGVTNAVLDGVALSDNATGVLVRGDNAFTTFGATLTLQNGTAISGGATGLGVKGSAANLNGDTLANTSFSGQSGNYITLTNGGLHGHELNATLASFDSKTGATATPSQNYGIEDKILHAVDDSTLGFVRVKAGNVFVTPNSFNSPATTTPSIQRGIDAASPGDTAHVESSTYNESPQINKSITLAGDGRDTTTIALLPAGTPGTGYLSAVEISGHDVTVSGFTIVGNDAVGSGLANSDFLLDPGLGTVNIQDNRIKVGEIGTGANGDDGVGLLTTYTTTPSQFVDTLNVSGNDFVPSNATGHRPFYINTGVTNFNFHDNAITGTFHGRAITEANNGLVQNNTVTGTGAAGSRSAGLGTFGDTDQTLYGHTTFSGNTLTNLAGGISIFSANNTSLQNNQFVNDDNGVLVDDEGSPTSGPLSAFSGNTFTGNVNDINDDSPVNLTPDGTNVFDGVTLSGASTAQIYAIEDKIVDAIDVNGDGLVTLKANNVYTTPNSFVAPATAATIQNAVIATPSGNVLHIEAGSYTGDVDTTGKTLTLDPGDGAVAITNNGNVTLDAGTTLHMEIGSSSDKLVVNGTVNLGGATLDTSGSTITATPGQQVELIENDGSDHVTGNFAGAPEGNVISVNGQPFFVFYDEGTGNDVTLTRAPDGTPIGSPTAPSVVYVNSSWTTFTNGQDPDGPTGGTLGNGTAKGYDEFDNIQAAINAVASGGTIKVYAGTYVADGNFADPVGVVDKININKPLSLIGPNANYNPNTDPLPSLASQAVITTATSDASIFDSSAVSIIGVNANNVTIRGFTIDGSNNALTHSVTFNGVGIDAAEGISSYTDVGSINVSNNIVQNIAYAGVDFENGNNAGNATSNNVISNNMISHLGDPADGFGIGVILYDNFYAQVTGNVMKNVRGGVQTGNFYQANPGPAGSATISDNAIEARRSGIFYNLSYSDASPFTVDNNTITASSVADSSVTHWDGILLTSQQSAVSASFTGNTIDGSGTSLPSSGVEVWNTPTTGSLTVNGGTISGVQKGVWVNNFEGYNSNADHTKVTINGVNITASQYGVYVLDSPSNTNGSAVTATITGDTDITTGPTGTGIFVSGSDASATIDSNNSSIHGNAIGIDVNGGSAAITNNHIYDNGTGVRFTNGGGGSLIGNDFGGATDNSTDVRLDADAGAVTVGDGNKFNASTIYIDNRSAQGIDLSGATATTFAGVNSAGLDPTNASDLATLFSIEDKIVHKVDLATAGLVRVKAGHVFVTTNSFVGAGSADINRGIGAASPGDIVNLADGTYVNQVEIAKAITLLGQSQSGTIIQSPASLPLSFTSSAANHPVVYIHNTVATVKNLTVDGNGQGGGANNRIVGVGLHNAAGTLDHLTIEHVRQTPLNGVQEGNAILDVNDDSAARTVNVTNNNIFDYQKNGMTLSGAGLNVSVTGNTVTGAGPTAAIAQNGIELFGGVTGNISGNTVSGNSYTPQTVTSTGILLFQAGATTISNNILDGNDVGIDLFQSGNSTISGDTIGATTPSIFNGISLEDGSATITNETIHGSGSGDAAIGVYSESGDAHNSGATINGGTFTNSSFGVQVEDDNASDSVHAEAVIDGATIHSSVATSVGIDVNGGLAKIQNTDLTSNHEGLLVENEGVADAGGGDTTNNVTGLGSSIGKNNFAGYVGASGHNYAIDDENSQPGPDVYAIHNKWGAGVTTNSVLEQKVFDVNDDPTKTTVFFEPPDDNPTGPVNTVYVDDNFSDKTIGQTFTFSDGSGSHTVTYGTDAFDRIQDGINGVSAGGTVVVEAGTYSENLTVAKSVHVLGAGQNVVTVYPSKIGVVATNTSSSLPSAASNSVLIQSSDVEIAGMTFDGDNPNLHSGVEVGGHDIDARNGIIEDFNAGTFNNTNVHDVTVQNIWLRGIYASSGGTGFKFDNNTVTDVRGSDSSIAIFNFGGSGEMIGNHVSDANDAISTNHSTGTVIENNVVTNSDSGIHSDNVGDGGGTSDLIQGNTVTNGSGSSSYGIFVFANYLPVTVKDNIITDVAVGLAAYGHGPVDSNVDPVTFDHNTVSRTTPLAGSQGLLVSTSLLGFGDADVHAIVTHNNDISGFDTGIATDDSAGKVVTLEVTNNSSSIHGNNVGIDVNTGTATITGNHIYDNTVGIRIEDGATATVSSNSFEGGSTALENGTDLELASSGATLTGGVLAGNTFAATSYYINNGTANNIDATANTFDTNNAVETNNFRIEDRIFHKVDDLTKGLVTWVGHNTFVTTPGAGSTDSSIQRGIDATNAGDTLNIEGGSYAENVTISKAINIDGQGSGPTPLVNWTGANSNALVTILSTTSTDNVSIQDIAFDGSNGAGEAILSNANASYGMLTVNRATFGHFSFDAISINGDAVNGVSARNVVVSNSSFSNNGSSGNGGAGDISLFQYNGNASFSNLTLVGSSVGNTGTRVGIQLRGVGNDTVNGTDVKPMGTVSFSNVDISGNYRTSFIGLQRYSNVSGLILHNVALGGATSNITGTFGDLLRFDAVGSGSAASPATVSLGNTDFRGVSNSSPQQSLLEFAPDNTFTFLRADATGTSWNLGSGDIAASALTLSQAFAVEDRILDYVKPDNAGQPFKGWAEIQDGKALITPISSNISRGIQMVDTGGTVWVNDGTYTQDVAINKSVSLLSANGSGVTTINGVGTGFTGAVKVNSGVSNVSVGSAGHGFTINGAGQAAVYLEGNNSSVTVRDNVIHSSGAGDNALLTGGGQHSDTIRDNSFTGTSAQLVYVNGAASVSNASDHVDFINNQFTGAAPSGPLLGLEAANSQVTGNTFSGDSAVRLGVTATGDTISGNTFSNANTNAATEQFDATFSGGYDIPGIVAANTFDRAVTLQHGSGYVQAIWANIQGGVNASVNGDTVHASVGVFDPEVSVTKSITLAGAQAGNAANGVAHNATRTGGESQINNGFNVTAPDVTIDGFLIVGADGVNDPSAGISLSGSQSGYTIVNNIIRGNVIGLYLNSNGTDATLVKQNLFDENNISGPAGQTAIYSDSGLQKATIDTNTFTMNESAITIGATPSTVNANITITHNNLDDDGSIYILKTNGGSIDNNTLNSPVVSSSGIYLGGGDSNLNIHDNNISGRTAAVRVVDDGYGFGSNSNITISHNTLTGNTTGVQVGSGTVTISGGNTISGAITGVDLIGGSTSVIGNTITGNTGSGVSASGASTKALIQGNTLTGNHVGIHVDSDAIVDAGSDNSLDGNPTGLGNSAGGNTLTGYTGTGGSYAIEDMNKTVAAGGLGRDVLARSNNFGTSTSAATEGVVYDDTDDPTRTRVIFSQFAVTGTTIDLTSDSTSPNGSSTDNITNINKPHFAGTTAAGATVQVGIWVDANHDNVVDSSEVTLLAPTTAANGSGNWSLVLSSPLADGTYTFVAKATDAFSNVDFSAALTVTIDTNVTVNTTPDMTAATDTGASNSDNRTRDNTPTFDGHTEPNSFVELLLDGTTVIASGNADTNGDWELTATMAISNGSHSISARVTDIAGNVGLSPALTPVIVDTLPPAPPTGAFDLNGTPPTAAQHMDVSFPFSEDVHSSVQNTDLHLTNLTTSTTIDPSDIIAHTGPGNTVYFTFNPGTYPMGILPDGNYHGFINASDIQDEAGNAMTGEATVDFFFLNGDANRDRKVNALDFNILATNFGQTGTTFQQGDFNYDGQVSSADFVILAQQFNKFLAPPAAPIADAAPVTGLSMTSVSGKSTPFSTVTIGSDQKKDNPMPTDLAADVLA